ncbi:hypothetical protein QP958_10815 [Corynebacterium marquesiae]|uniref:hypothetical protein n=1 Tax=Corynebacterium marquesiae TaxID=2913503 RepID=UPI00254B1770|nr:hypothetical protein [Corynebacterium marquesiae]MDK8455881.1 hypothetical protein [Corynebacterium marquesiae]MDK8726026.1 hypothetical protein [Corynebacterium marquesiae]MDK8771317.1 hypothetical protein [Corynebacterium marquesiae]
MITKSQTASSVKKIEALRQERKQKEAEEAKKVEEFKRQLGEVLYACAYESSSKWAGFRGGSVKELLAEIGIREVSSREASEEHEGAHRGVDEGADEGFEVGSEDSTESAESPAGPEHADHYGLQA